MKMIPYVESLIDRCSFKAPSRAASEWIKACHGQTYPYDLMCILTLFTIIPPKLCATNIRGRRVACYRQSISCLSQGDLTSASSLFKHRSETSALAWSYKYWQLTRELLCVFASYPQHRMRALGMSVGRRSRSQCTPLEAVHVLSRCPFKPCTATILRICEKGRCGVLEKHTQLLGRLLPPLLLALADMDRCRELVVAKSFQAVVL
jgi:hypothetical protein